jgi:hypothetical protein
VADQRQGLHAVQVKHAARGGFKTFFSVSVVRLGKLLGTFVADNRHDIRQNDTKPNDTLLSITTLT